MRQQLGSNLRVVVDHVRLGELPSGKQHFVQMGDGDSPPPYIECPRRFHDSISLTGNNRVSHAQGLILALVSPSTNCKGAAIFSNPRANPKPETLRPEFRDRLPLSASIEGFFYELPDVGRKREDRRVMK